MSAWNINFLRGRCTWLTDSHVGRGDKSLWLVTAPLLLLPLSNFSTFLFFLLCSEYQRVPASTSSEYHYYDQSVIRACHPSPAPLPLVITVTHRGEKECHSGKFKSLCQHRATVPPSYNPSLCGEIKTQHCARWGLAWLWRIGEGVAKISNNSHTLSHKSNNKQLSHAFTTTTTTTITNSYHTHSHKNNKQTNKQSSILSMREKMGWERETGLNGNKAKKTRRTKDK